MPEISTSETQIYSVLAEVYDVLMDEVNYELWADFIDEIIIEHHPEPTEVLELACGTGTMALSLEEFDCYNITATDASPQMINKAREKASKTDSKIDFRTMDFLSIDLDKRYDVIYMVFDSINYLLSDDDIHKFFGEIKKVLNSNGIFIFDFTTPRNSVKSIKYLNNESGTAKTGYKYYRTTRFDRRENMHYNDFMIYKLDSNQKIMQNYREIHKQRIHTLHEMESFIEKSELDLVTAYDGFQLKPAHKNSLRVTMVLQ